MDQRLVGRAHQEGVGPVIRCTIEMLPGGIEDHPRRRTIGVVEIANVGGSDQVGTYRAILSKNLDTVRAGKGGIWRQAHFAPDAAHELEVWDVVQGKVVGFPRQRLGPYDLLYRALEACGLAARNR